MPSTLLIRADASVAIGTGHIMRMIALGQAWQAQGREVHFLCAEITPALESRLKEEGFLLEKIQASPGSRKDLDATCAAIARYGEFSIPITLDGYQFDADFQLGLKKTGCRLIVMDDYGHAAFYHADWVINQNIGADENLYSRRAVHTRLLLGPRYTLIRPEFLKWREWQREVPPFARKVLVTFGGSDPDNLTGLVVEALKTLINFEITIVVGSSYSHIKKIEKSITEAKSKMHLVENASNMPELMISSDIGIIVAGTTLWEALYLGLPLLSYTRHNLQKKAVDILAQMNAIISLGSISEFNSILLAKELHELAANPVLRMKISCNERSIIDGKGGQLLVSKLIKHSISNSKN